MEGWEWDGVIVTVPVLGFGIKPLGLIYDLKDLIYP
jgi:hypothetical protein